MITDIFSVISIIFEQIITNNFIQDFLIEMIGAAIGAFMAIEGSLYLFHRETKEKIIEKHFSKIKKEILKPWLDNFEISADVSDNPLFKDLKNHFPDLIELWELHERLKNEEIEKTNEMSKMLEQKYSTEFYNIQYFLINPNDKDYEPRPDRDGIVYNSGTYACIDNQKEEIVKSLKELSLSDEANKIRYLHNKIIELDNKIKYQIRFVLSKEKLRGKCEFVAD